MGSAEPAASALLVAINRLKAEQKALKESKKRVAKELRNQEKKRQRLKRKASALTDEDLLQVLHLRAASKAETAAKCAASSSGGAQRPEPPAPEEEEQGST